MNTDTTQIEYANYNEKLCILEGCHAKAGVHMYYDTTLCEDHALDDEINRDDIPQEIRLNGSDNEK